MNNYGRYTKYAFQGTVAALAGMKILDQQFRISSLEKKLANEKQASLLYKEAFEKAVDLMPKDKLKTLNVKLDETVEFYKIISQL